MVKTSDKKDSKDSQSGGGDGKRVTRSMTRAKERARGRGRRKKVRWGAGCTCPPTCEMCVRLTRSGAHYGSMCGCTTRYFWPEVTPDGPPPASATPFAYDSEPPLGILYDDDDDELATSTGFPNENLATSTRFPNGDFNDYYDNKYGDFDDFFDDNKDIFGDYYGQKDDDSSFSDDANLISHSAPHIFPRGLVTPAAYFTRHLRSESPFEESLSSPLSLPLFSPPLFSPDTTPVFSPISSLSSVEKDSDLTYTPSSCVTIIEKHNTNDTNNNNNNKKKNTILGRSKFR